MPKLSLGRKEEICEALIRCIEQGKTSGLGQFLRLDIPGPAAHQLIGASLANGIGVPPDELEEWRRTMTPAMKEKIGKAIIKKAMQKKAN